MTLSDGTLSPVFDPGTTSYTAGVENAVASLDVTAVLADESAALTVNNDAAGGGEAVHVPLNVGSNTITIVVTAKDKQTKTYTVTVTRSLPSKADVVNTAGTTTVTYMGTTIDLASLSTLFTVDTNAGPRTYTVESGGTGEGTINGSILTVEKAGPIQIGLATAETETHYAGVKQTATLTVNKGDQSAPSGLSKTSVTTHGGSDGAITGLTASTSYEYKQEGGSSYTPVTASPSGEITGLAAGSYVVRLAATELYKAGADSAAVIVGQPENTPTAGIDYSAEQLTGLTAGAGYTVNGEAVTADNAGKLAIDSSWLGTMLSIVKPGNGTTTEDSAAQTLDVPARGTAPSSVGKTDETALHAANGTLTGLSTGMEYKKGAAGAWSEVTGSSVTGLAPDTYYVRIKATATTFASAEQSITVNAYTLVKEITPTAGIDYSAEQLTGLTAGAGYTVNGEAVTADNDGKLA
ncbi:cadherin-like beta sandwich domain-containing protein, partial [Paenibacillus mesotrionivorans]